MNERGSRRTLVGTVVSNKMDKTVVVSVERLVQDQRYKKYIRRYSRFMAAMRSVSTRSFVSAGSRP